MTTYMCTKNSRVHVTQYLLPVVAHKLCQIFWLELLISPRMTFVNWFQAVGRSRNILPLDDGLIGQVSNNCKHSVHDAVSQYVEIIDTVDGHALSCPRTESR